MKRIFLAIPVLCSAVMTFSADDAARRAEAERIQRKIDRVSASGRCRTLYQESGVDLKGKDDVNRRDFGRWAMLNAQARNEAKVPIRVGEPGKAPFWNVKSRAFMRPPAFDFGPLDDAKGYRFTLTAEASMDNPLVWVATQPWVALDAKVWDGLRPGYYTVKVEGVAEDGRDLGVAGERTFYRAAVFEGPYPVSAGDYRMAARRVYASVFRSQQVQAWLTSDTPPEGYDLYCYPAKILSSMIRALCRHAQAEPKDAENALAIASKMANWLMAQSQPDGTPFAHFPPTYWGDRRDVAVKNAGRNMLGYPAQAALAYFDLWDAMGEDKYREAALAIGRTYVRTQGEDGTWPLLVMEKDGSPVSANRLVPERYVLGMFDRAYAVTKDNAFKESAERAFNFVTRGPCRTWNWDGQFEDIEPKPPYANLQKGVAIDTANRMFATGGDKVLACELIDWCEDQFVVWSEPVHNMDWKHWKTPTALEQYEYYTPIDASMGDMIGGWANAYRATGNVLYLEKACAFADNILRNQRADGSIPTYFDSRKGSDWVNCMVYVADRLEVLAAIR